MRKEKKLSGSLFVKIVVFFLLATAAAVGFVSACVSVMLYESDAYDYQAMDNSVEKVAREMMVNDAWNEMNDIRLSFLPDSMDKLEEYCEGKNFSVEIYKEEELLWSNYSGEDTPYSFRYTYSEWVPKADAGDTIVIEDSQVTYVQEADAALNIQELQQSQLAETTDVGEEQEMWDEESEFVVVTEYYDEETALEPGLVLKEFTCRLYVDPDFPYDDEYCMAYNRAVMLCQFRYLYPAVALGSILMVLICFIFLMCSAGHKNGREGIGPSVLTCVHLDIFTIVFGVVALFGMIVIFEAPYWGFGALVELVLIALLGSVEVVWCTIFCMEFALRLKLGAWWRHTLIAAACRLLMRIVRFFCKGIKVLIKGLPLVLNVAIIFMGICIVEFFVILGWCESFTFIALWFMEKLILFPIVIYLALVCKKLQEGSKALAEGDLSFKLDTSKMLLDFKEHGENLNQIGDGIAKAVEERMRSERLKTELITNVSHDLKTPLTSIINYADLLAHEVSRRGNATSYGEEAGENEGDKKVAEYSEVLLRQSKRLRKLLEDLVEASKATTGALEVNLTRCEIGVLLSQAVGEYEQRFAEKQLNLIVHQPEEPVHIMADGRHLWRVFDNLMNNICKYAQENTRVYLSVEKKEQQVEIIFRNMSKYALDISAEELEERFVRGDKSRHMEGNGLGLSIAKSLIELQNGQMKLVTDGDLFKVTLYFEAV